MPRKSPSFQPTRDAMCWEALRNGVTTVQLAMAIGVTDRTIRRWIVRAKENPKAPQLELLLLGYSGDRCDHGIPIGTAPDGLPWLCLWCDLTGIPNHPAFRQGVKEEPTPPPKSTLSEGEENKVVWELPAK